MTSREATDAAEMADVCQQRSVHPEHVLEVRQHLLGIEAARSTANLFAVLADATRLQVLYALLHVPGGELCVCDLAAAMGRDDTTISHQLRVLRNQDIVAMRKVGRVVYYRLVDKHIRQLLLQYPTTDRKNEENLTPPPADPDMRHDNKIMPTLSSGSALGVGLSHACEPLLEVRKTEALA